RGIVGRVARVGVGLGCAELAEEREDLVLTLEGELDVLALGDLDLLVLAGRRGLALEDHVAGLLLEGGLRGRPHAREVVALVGVVLAALGRRVGGEGGAGQGEEQRQAAQDDDELPHSSLHLLGTVVRAAVAWARSDRWGGRVAIEVPPNTRSMGGQTGWRDRALSSVRCRLPW